MCNLSQGVEQSGYEKGVENAMLNAIRNLMDSMKWTAEQAMDALKVPDAERQNYLEQLKK